MYSGASSCTGSRPSTERRSRSGWRRSAGGAGRPRWPPRGPGTDEQARWEAFAESSSEWRAIQRPREFLAAAREAAGALDGPHGDRLAAHFEFAERRLDEADPLVTPELLLPRVREPKPDDLRPYLEGWSPHGPDEGRW